VLFVSENIGGHATVHLNLEAALGAHPEIDATFLHVPPPGTWRRVVGATVPGLGRLDLDLQPLRAQLALSAWVRRRLRRLAEQFDVLHVYTANAGLLSTHLLGRLAVVVTTDSTNALNAYRLAHRSPTRWTGRVLPLSMWFERRVYEAATTVVANSEWVLESLRATYHVRPDKLRCLPFGVVLPDRLPPRTHEELPAITFVGRQLERKGGRRLLALHQRYLVDRCILNVVTGEEVPAAPGVRVFRDFTPGDPRLTELLRSSRAFVFPSPIDQAPNVVLEAMAAGVAVVGLGVGAVPEMVEEGVTGYLVSPGDDRALLAAIGRLLDDEALAVAMGDRGRARAAERYDIARSAAGLVGILAEAAERGPRPGAV
jgi:alpha-maltose-1-phosphate synthase